MKKILSVLLSFVMLVTISSTFNSVANAEVADDYSFYGESTLNFTIKGNILSLWHDEIIKLFPNEDLEIDETGTYLLEQYAKNLNYDAVEIKYYTEVSEIVIYNTNVIHII